ncbi:MAG: helix-turn-helix transcriptional regulator [Proteobacteria bacterium]|nr:helix-turn-helix transcriptional regulator [Pseudomonadota bacterium]MBU4119488.1 helix-turn-helix transcriptional regulator [Pseudomonadota bacterium]
MKKTDELKNVLGPALRSIRKELGLTQAIFAKSLGITGAYVSDLERGLAVPSEPVVRQMESIYKINRKFLFSGDGRPFLSVMRPPVPLPQLSFPPVNSIEFEQVDYVVSAIPHLAELIEIRGKDDKRESAVNYILLWHNGENRYFPTHLSCDTPEREAEIRQIREACWRVGTTLSYVDGSQNYYAKGESEGDVLNLLEELVYAEDDGYLLEGLGEYENATGNRRRVLAYPGRREEIFLGEQPYSISKMLTQAAVILESKTDYGAALAATIKAFGMALAGEKGLSELTDTESQERNF